MPRLQQPIETKRLLLRELIEEDFKDIYLFKSDPQVVKYLNWGPNNQEQTQKSLRKQIAFQTEEKRRIYVLAVVLKDTKEVIGNALFMIEDDDFETAEIGYFLNSKFWKNGFGKEVVEGLLYLGFYQIKMHRIYAVCDVKNIGSIKILKKTGFRLEGHFIKNLKVKGEWRDNYLFAILKEEV